MPRLNEMYPSPYLKADDAEDGDLSLTIARVVQETVGQGKDAEMKWVVRFKEDDRGLVLNKTNAKSCEKLFASDDTSDWIGQKITLYATEVQFAGEMVAALRVRTTGQRPMSRPRTVPTTSPIPNPIPTPTTAVTADEDIPF